MTGKQLDNEMFDKKIADVINKNPDKPYLEGFKNWAKSGTKRSRRTIYNYLLYVLHFLNYIQKDITEIELDDYTRYADAQSKLSSSNQIAKYSAIKCFAKYLKASRKIKYNFMEDAERPKFIESQETKEKRQKKHLTIKQMHQMFRNIEIGVGNERALWLQNEYRLIHAYLKHYLVNKPSVSDSSYLLDHLDSKLNILMYTLRNDSYPRLNFVSNKFGRNVRYFFFRKIYL